MNPTNNTILITGGVEGISILGHKAIRVRQTFGSVARRWAEFSARRNRRA
jgi:short-subunit dehydrogenase involved in D-alanine esterification of teichoic acids